jgi:hypothetical protein
MNATDIRNDVEQAMQKFAGGKKVPKETETFKNLVLEKIRGD